MSPVTRGSLAKDLRDLGVAEGGVVMVHASLRKLGPVDGGAASVVGAVLDAVGPRGTMLMVLSAAEGPFDPERTPVDTSDMGVLAEVFRTYPGTRINDHPADRFGANGPDADALLFPSPLHDYHGPGSVLERLVALDGQVLRLGANPDTVTLTHYAEYLAEVPDKRRVARPYVLAGGQELTIESLDDTDGIAAWEHGDYFPRILLDYVDAGRARVGSVGNTTAELLGARDFSSFATSWMTLRLCERA